MCLNVCVIERTRTRKLNLLRIVVTVQSQRERERERERRTDLGEGALGHEDAVQCKAGDAQDGGESDAPADHSGAGRVDVGVVGQGHVVDQTENHDELHRQHGTGITVQPFTVNGRH